GHRRHGREGRGQQARVAGPKAGLAQGLCEGGGRARGGGPGQGATGEGEAGPGERNQTERRLLGAALPRSVEGQEQRLAVGQKEGRFPAERHSVAREELEGRRGSEGQDARVIAARVIALILLVFMTSLD